MKRFCIDTGFFIALYDERDQYHASALREFGSYFERTANQLLVPWPVLYEAVNTRFVGNRRALDRVRTDWLSLKREDRLLLIDDAPFRDAAIEELLTAADPRRAAHRGLSLADRVIRGLLSQPSLRIDCFITCDPGDFADVCRRHRRQLLPLASPSR